PGTMFLIVVGITYLLHRMNREQIVESWKVAGGQIVGAGVALLFALPLVRVLINSGPAFNSTGLDSMPITLAEGAASLAGQTWPSFRTCSGAVGAFTARSNTVSNLTFAPFPFATAQNIGAIPEVVVAAQGVGGAAANMIAIHNIVAAAATVGLLGQEGPLLRKTIFPTVYYCALTGAIAHIWINGVGFNIGTVGLVVVLAALAYAAVRLRGDVPATVSSSQEAVGA